MAGHATVAERYARAIFDLGVETGTLAALADQVRQFAAAYQTSDDLRSVLENPLVPLEKRQQILGELATKLGAGPFALNTLRYLAQRRRLKALPDIARRLDTLSDEKQGVMRATVTAAATLPEACSTRLTSCRRTRRKRSYRLGETTGRPATMLARTRPMRRSSRKVACWPPADPTFTPTPLPACSPGR